MSQKRSGLGRNLSALLSQSGIQLKANEPVAENIQVTYRPITSLVPGQYQPRRIFSEETIAELADSIRKQGLLQPLVVRELQTDQYEIIAGERRWRACQQIGMSDIPVIIRKVDDETAIALALIENLQREDLSALEQARAMQCLINDFALSHQQIADLLSKSRTAVTNHLRLLNLSSEVQTFLEQGTLDMGHARCLLTLSATEQKRIADKIIAQALSVREAEKLVADSKNTVSNPRKQKWTYAPSIQTQVKTLAQHLQTDVRLKGRDAEKGTIVIHYNDLGSLDQIINKLLGSV
jgi:ParB family chromosome partitioning protein